MSPKDLAAELRSRINPVYAAQIGTESYERRLCAEAIEGLIAQRDELLAALKYLQEHRLWINSHAKSVIESAITKVQP